MLLLLLLLFQQLHQPLQPPLLPSRPHQHPPLQFIHPASPRWIPMRQRITDSPAETISAADEVDTADEAEEEDAGDSEVSRLRLGRSDRNTQRRGKTSLSPREE